ncbi:hypothetical protein COLO4_33664 [Corchorus olitorius]|uniref:Uncharacterized protein n=1 Tax=Corchorus olitorius TaxID=93759 RepID=A0A1R3GSB3_9ROSI|nr:hypothetical protein COLO4_33664 [Corchorus olitorius]
MGAKIGIATFLALLLLIKQEVHGQFQFQQVEEAEEVCATINEGLMLKIS